MEKENHMKTQRVVAHQMETRTSYTTLLLIALFSDAKRLHSRSAKRKHVDSDPQASSSPMLSKFVSSSKPKGALRLYHTKSSLLVGEPGAPTFR